MIGSYELRLCRQCANGYKRTAYELVRLFLRSNGHEIKSNPDDTYRLLLGIASRDVSAGGVEKWIGMNLTEL